LRAQLFGDVLRRTLESLHPLLPARLDLGTPTTVSSRLNKWLEQPDLVLDLPPSLPDTEALNRRAVSLETAWRLVRERPEVSDPTARKAWHRWLEDHPARIRNLTRSNHLPNWQTKLNRLLDMSVPPDSASLKALAMYYTRDEVHKRWGNGNFQPDTLLLALWDYMEQQEALDSICQQWMAGLVAHWLGTLPATLREMRSGLGRQSFQDLLTILREALLGPGGDTLAATLRERYRAALVDEFQDTDPVQWDILSKIFPAGSPLVLVGDPKQAIYAFRGGDVYAYLRARRENEARARSARLETCHRSDAPLLAAFNRLFSRPAGLFRSEGILYSHVGHRAAARIRRADGSPAPALCLQLQPEEIWAASKSRRSHWVVEECTRQVSRLLAGELELEISPGQWRTPVGGDIALLVSSHSQARQIHASLNQAGIPAQRISLESVFDSSEARGLRPILLALRTPGDPSLLLCALAGGLCDTDGATLEACAREPQRLAPVAALFQRCAELWRRSGIAPALGACLDGLGVPGALLARLDGARALTNLRHLQELLLQLEHEQGLSPADLLPAWEELLRSSERSGEQAQLRLESDESLVQVVTIHASKGLEYPLVFAPFLWADSLQAAEYGVEYHDEAGARRLDLGSAQQDLHREAAFEEHLAERVRLCYVALTRARHQVRLICGPPAALGPDQKSRGRRVNGLGALVLGSDSQPSTVAELEARQISATRAEWLQALEAVRDGLPEDLRHVIQVQSDFPQLADPAPAGPVDQTPLMALPLPAGREQRTWIGSFSSLSHDTGDTPPEAPEVVEDPDHDQSVTEEPTALPP
ncbi:MAG: UvrD-helicase domain-containing protein, partial [Candidatus Cloacimonetes bacterium]|nr:UvrD-helicase domain-containing protein [Candidatus Cloacimonadota bacterium]